MHATAFSHIKKNKNNTQAQRSPQTLQGYSRTMQSFALFPQCIANGQHFEALQMGERVSNHQTLCMFTQPFKAN